MKSIYFHDMNVVDNSFMNFSDDSIATKNNLNIFDNVENSNSYYDMPYDKDININNN